MCVSARKSGKEKIRRRPQRAQIAEMIKRKTASFAAFGKESLWLSGTDRHRHVFRKWLSLFWTEVVLVGPAIIMIIMAGPDVSLSFILQQLCAAYSRPGTKYTSFLSFFLSWPAIMGMPLMSSLSYKTCRHIVPCHAAVFAGSNKNKKTTCSYSTVSFCLSAVCVSKTFINSSYSFHHERRNDFDMIPVTI